MLKEYELDEEDIEIINELDELCGVSQNKEVLRDMVIYSKLRQNGEMEFGNYNIIIRKDSAYNFMNELLKICGKLFVKNGIIENSEICYLDRVELKRDEKEIDKIQKLEEGIVVINERRVRFNYEEEAEHLASVCNNLRHKILVFEDTYFRDGEADAELGDIASWRMTIEKISLEDKIAYCTKMFDNNNLTYDDGEIASFADQPFWMLKKATIKIIVDCKAKGTAEIAKEMLEVRKLGEATQTRSSKKEDDKTAKEELEEIVGLDEVKGQLSKILNYIKINKERGKMPTLHMCFTGNPGTGKTTMARIIGKMFREENILDGKGKFVEIHGRDLVGKYVGWTAKQVHDTIKKAMGGVLFVDEAYSLDADRRGSFEDEAIATLIKEMEDHRNEICIILAGYTNEMERLIKRNPGFESRIQFTVDFPNYSENELLEIFENMCKSESYKLTNGCKELLLENFREAKETDNFANGRYVRNIFEKAKFEQADRVVKTSSKNINTITIADIKQTIEKERPKEEKRAIGFSA